MTSLTHVYLQANHLKQLPEEIKNLTGLETLDVSLNHLVEIPAAIGCLRSLKKLILTQNHIISLPSSLGNLTRLVSLQLGRNSLQVLQNVVFYFPYSNHLANHRMEMQCVIINLFHIFGKCPKLSINRVYSSFPILLFYF